MTHQHGNAKIWCRWKEWQAIPKAWNCLPPPSATLRWTCRCKSTTEQHLALRSFVFFSGSCKHLPHFVSESHNLQLSSLQISIGNPLCGLLTLFPSRTQAPRERLFSRHAKKIIQQTWTPPKKNIPNWQETNVHSEETQRIVSQKLSGDVPFLASCMVASGCFFTAITTWVVDTHYSFIAA